MARSFAQEREFVESREGGTRGGDGKAKDEGARLRSRLPWFVPSGALGAAFYAVTAGGVFGGVGCDYLLGEFAARYLPAPC